MEDVAVSDPSYLTWMLQPNVVSVRTNITHNVSPMMINVTVQCLVEKGWRLLPAAQFDCSLIWQL
jgi:hypothetical protein